jgi:hypothetical protein
VITRCFSCGLVKPERMKTTETGETICSECDAYYALGGPGEEEVIDD